MWPSIPRQAASSVIIFAVKRPQDADPCHHGWAVGLSDQDQRLDRGPPLLELLFVLRQLLNILGGVLERGKVAAAGQRNWIVETAAPSFFAPQRRQPFLSNSVRKPFRCTRVVASAL